MNTITLTGQLICQDEGELAIVAKQLPRHIEATRAEPGCISFEVTQTEDPLVWDVSECFQDVLSFEFHQARVKASEWGRATAGIKRSYLVSGL
ncbi:quinol monooxygenase YgiN [Arthrobacter silviterrae]|uniref:Antibiotic biosynthesis monooxygenase n=1 Tax=Arthrobacter silviterrae TaxID=2026658 RepID=A0ABX0D5X0_9MICC|nr:antibiotic biosynthesis monooxygenase [Arthrobacter silviterrae]MDQ0279439.1 quinol monooxygenase YgiN [Arthrobacter silviterrae]NGN82081.1 antibiotic biosynthesis monooxygenase [Arthrobacter silviterrae]